MSGPIVRTGTTPAYGDNWDRIFGGSKAKAKPAVKAKAEVAKATAKVEKVAAKAASAVKSTSAKAAAKVKSAAGKAKAGKK
jgi:hypothetical protein